MGQLRTSAGAAPASAFVCFRDMGSSSAGAPLSGRNALRQDALAAFSIVKFACARPSGLRQSPHATAHRRRIAREAILYERKLACDSVEGRLICDEIASADAMDAAVDRVVAGLTDAGPVSAIGNRRAFRVAQEPLEAFRRYASVYAREQAYCHFSPALIANLDLRRWATSASTPCSGTISNAYDEAPTSRLRQARLHQAMTTRS